jgi:hypothetical protein
MSESDRSLLRRLADDGNQEAADRLAELAADRGDLEELRRLVDDGNEQAADRLAELAADRGDLEKLRRLVDDGNENAIGWPNWPQTAAILKSCNDCRTRATSKLRVCCPN